VTARNAVPLRARAKLALLGAEALEAPSQIERHLTSAGFRASWMVTLPEVLPAE
jgi:hypothetical protein